jgi:hypothetical protein
MARRANLSCLLVCALSCEVDTAHGGHRRSFRHSVLEDMLELSLVANRGCWAPPFLKLALAVVPVKICHVYILSFPNRILHRCRLRSFCFHGEME